MNDLGAHVSAAGGVHQAPGRAAQLGSVVLQLFTKQPNRWAERELDAATIDAWHAAIDQHGIRTTAAHDSYLINLGSPDATLFARSRAAFQRELERCAALDIEFLVTHPGNATDGDRERALRANADAIAEALDAVPARTAVLLEITAGAGAALGASFAELARMLDRIGHARSNRTGVCLDTCHLFAAGYDIVHAYDAVFADCERTLGTDRVRLFHLNDSLAPLGSRRDRHAHIGFGQLGDAPFRRILTDPRFVAVPKLIETPKDDDALIADRRNLERLRSLRSDVAPTRS
ncbi:MAG: deoxyribonuclease IV [Longimicrobiales bacterium]